MMSISETIESLRVALSTCTDEHKLLALISEQLSLLRSSHRQSKSDFTNESIQFLKSLNVVESALREFIEALDEKDLIHTHDDAQELACRFGELGEQLAPYLVTKRAEKEMRELISKAKTLPFSAVRAGEIDFHHRLSHLENSGKKCRKCGAKMVLRESQHGYFWGCSTFPKCFGKRWLSSEEAMLLDL